MIRSFTESLKNTGIGINHLSWNRISFELPQTSLTSTLISCFWFFKRSILVWFERIDDNWSPNMQRVNRRNSKLSRNKKRINRKWTSSPHSKLLRAQIENLLITKISAYPQTTLVKRINNRNNFWLPMPTQLFTQGPETVSGYRCFIFRCYKNLVNISSAKAL